MSAPTCHTTPGEVGVQKPFTELAAVRTSTKAQITTGKDHGKEPPGGQKAAYGEWQGAETLL